MPKDTIAIRPASPASKCLQRPDSAFSRGFIIDSADSQIRYPAAMVTMPLVLQCQLSQRITTAITGWRELTLISEHAGYRHSGAWLGSPFTHVFCGVNSTAIAQSRIWRGLRAKLALATCHRGMFEDLRNDR